MKRERLKKAAALVLAMVMTVSASLVPTMRVGAEGEEAGTLTFVIGDEMYQQHGNDNECPPPDTICEHMGDLDCENYECDIDGELDDGSLFDFIGPVEPEVNAAFAFGPMAFGFMPMNIGLPLTWEQLIAGPYLGNNGGTLNVVNGSVVHSGRTENWHGINVNVSALRETFGNHDIVFDLEFDPPLQWVDSVANRAAVLAGSGVNASWNPGASVTLTLPQSDTGGAGGDFGITSGIRILVNANVGSHPEIILKDINMNGASIIEINDGIIPTPLTWEQLIAGPYLGNNGGTLNVVNGSVVHSGRTENWHGINVNVSALRETFGNHDIVFDLEFDPPLQWVDSVANRAAVLAGSGVNANWNPGASVTLTLPQSDTGGAGGDFGITSGIRILVNANVGSHPEIILKDIKMNGASIIETSNGGPTPYELVDRLPGSRLELTTERAANAGNIAWDMKALTDQQRNTHFAGRGNRLENHQADGVMFATNGAGDGVHDSQGWNWAALTLLRSGMQDVNAGDIVYVTGRIGNNGAAMAHNGTFAARLGGTNLAPEIAGWGNPIPTTFNISFVVPALGTDNVEIRWNFNPQPNPWPETFAISVDDMIIVASGDPYATEREDLVEAITSAGMRIQSAYTTDSWGNLTSVLTPAISEQNNADGPRLIELTNDLNNAINDLVRTNPSSNWTDIINSDFVGIRGGSNVTLTSVANGIHISGRSGNNHGLLIDLNAIRTTYQVFTGTTNIPTITITGRTAIAGNVMLQATPSSVNHNSVSAQGEFTLQITASTQNTAPSWTSGFPFVTTQDGNFGELLITGIQVGTKEISDLLVMSETAAQNRVNTARTNIQTFLNELNNAEESLRLPYNTTLANIINNASALVNMHMVEGGNVLTFGASIPVTIQNHDLTLNLNTNPRTITGTVTLAIAADYHEGASAVTAVTESITITLQETPRSVITALALGGITVPRTGQTPIITPPTGGGAQWTASNITWEKNEPPNETADTQFSASTIYRARFTITPNPDYTLDGVLNDFTLTGAPTGTIVSREGETGNITIVFPVTGSSAADYITNLIIGGVVAPIRGVAPNATAPTGGGDQWTASISWYNINNPTPVEAGTHFSSAAKYRAVITINPSTNWANPPTATVFTITDITGVTGVTITRESGIITIDFPAMGGRCVSANCTGGCNDDACQGVGTDNTVITNNQTPRIGVWDVEAWDQQTKNGAPVAGEIRMVVNPAGHFSASWNDTYNTLFRSGRRFGEAGPPPNWTNLSRTHAQIGTISLSYNVSKYEVEGASYLGAYGWFTEPLIEWYVIDNWNDWRPGQGVTWTTVGQQHTNSEGIMTTYRGTIPVDGGNYHVLETTRTGPTIMGGADQQFTQIYSVRTVPRDELNEDYTISISTHINEWTERVSALLETSLLYEAAFVVEGYNGNNESNGHVVLNVLAMTIIPPTQPIEEFARFTLTNADSGAHIALGAIVPNQIESISFDFRNATGRNQVAVQGIPGHGNIGFPSAAAGEWVTITILQTGFMGAINTAATHIQVAPNGRAINDVFDIKNVVIVANGTTHNLPLSSIVTPGWGINRVVMSDAPEPDCPNCDNNPCTCPPPEGMDTLTSPVQTTTAVPSGRHVIFDSTRAEDNAATHLSIEGTNRGPFAAGNTVFFTNFGTHDTQNNPMGGIIRLTSFGGLVPGDVVQIAGRIGPNTAPALNPHDRGSFSVFGNQIFTDNNAVPTFRAEVTLTAGHISGATPLLINFNLWNFNVSPAVAFENIIIAVDQLVIHGVRMNETQATVALNAVYDAINTELGAIKAALDNPINYNMTAAMFTNRINAAVAAVTNPHRNLVSVTTAVSGGFDDVNPADFTGTITVSVVGATLPGQEPTPSTRIITLTGFNLPDAPECEAILLAAFYAVSGFFRGEDEFIKFAATNNATQALVMPRVNNVLARFPGVTAGTPTWAITPATATNNGLITISIPLSINPVIAGDVITRTFEAQLIIQRHHLVYSMEGDAMFQALATGATPSDFGWGNSSSVLRQAGHGTSGQLEVRTASGVNYLLVRQDNPNRGGSGYRMDIRTSGMVLGTANDNRMFEVRVTGRVQGTAPADMEMVMNIDGTNARVVASQQIIGSNTPFILAYEFTVEDLQNASRFGIYTLNGNGVNYTIESVTVMQIVGTPPVAPPPAVPPVFTIPPNFFPVDESAAAAASPPTEQQLEDIGLELPDDGVDVEFTYVPSLGRVGLEISVNHEDPNLEIPGILLITDDLDSGESVEYYYVKVEGYAETGTRISIVCADTQFEYGFVIAESPFTLAAFIPQNIITNNLAIIVSPMVGAIIESITSFVLFDVNITPTIATVLPPLPPQGPLAPDTPAGHFVPSAPPVPRADVLYRMSDYWGDAEELEDFGILYTSGSPTITLNQRLRRIEITERANHHDGIVINPYLGDGIHLQPGDIVRVEGRMPRASRGDGRFTMNMNMGGLTPRGDVSGISDAFPARRWTMEYTLQASDFDDMRGIVIQTYTWGAWPPFLYDFMVYDVIITRPHPTRPVERWNLQDILNRQTTRVGTSAAELGMFHSENSRARVVENDGVRSIYVTTGTSAWFTLEFCLTSETNIGVGDTVRVTGRNGNPPTATGTFGQMQINAQPGGWTPVAATHMANNLNAEGFWSLEFVVTETALNLMRNPLHGRRPGFAFQASANASFYLYDITVISSQATGRRPEQMSLEEIGCICEHCWPAGGPAPATPPPLTLEVGVVVDIGSDNIATFTADALYDEIINLIETGPMEPLMLNLFVLAPDDGITEVTAVIPGTAFAMINDADVNFVMQIQTPIATMRIPQTVLNAVKGDEIKIVFKEIEGTGRPVYEFVIIVDGEPLTDFSGGAVTIIIPYTLTRNENPHAIFVNFINPVTGELELVRGSFSGAAVTFAATHFSQFIINHNPVRFADIPQDFRAEVMFVGATGLMVGVGGNRFDPEAYVTREMMLVTLMRAAGIPQATDTTDNFIDAGGNRWYTGYVAQAKQLGITSGVGNDRFGIGNIVTNAEALILMYNTLEAIGMLPENAGGRTLEDFGDTDQLPRWVTDRMREGISLMTEAGIFAEQELNPTESMKRQMLARLLFNLMS